MSSLQILSPEQRIQQLESNLISVMAQVQDLDRQLRSSLAERADLLQRLENVEDQVTDDVLDDLNDLHGRLNVQLAILNVHDDRLDDLDGGAEEQQNDDSD
jgi:regulator of replication initiation timing